jgi:lysophospholipase L1-like esterase
MFSQLIQALVIAQAIVASQFVLVVPKTVPVKPQGQIIEVKPAPIVSPATVNVVSLGDSNTDGIFGGEPRQKVAIGSRYSDLIQAKNAGHSGNMVSMVTARINNELFPFYQVGKTNIATILVGVNDFNNGRTVDQAFADIQTLVAQIKARGWTVIVLTYPPVYYNNAINDQLKAFNQKIRMDRGNYFVIDSYYTLAGCSDCMFEDQLHLNIKGHALLAKSLNAQIKNYVL